MEDRWHGPEEPTDQDPETTPKKRRGTDFLSQYLLRRKEQQGEKPVDDEEEDEPAEKPKKFRRFFRNLFKSVVEPPEGQSEQVPKRFSLESLLTGERPQDEVHEEAASEMEEAHEVPTPELSNINEQMSATPEELLPKQTSSEQTAESVATTERDETNTPATTEVPLERQYVAPVIPERYNDRTVYERAVEPSKETAEKEVVIERGPGMTLPVVLVGAEYLARKKADRKLDAKFGEQVEQLKTENKQSNLVTEQLNTLVRQNREQLESLKRDRGISPSTPERPQPAPQERLERPIVRQERPTEQRPEQRVAVEAEPQRQPEKTVEPESYKIMEQVAKAAEQDVPVERVFERSHEVKDDQSTPVGAVSIGAIMARQTGRQRDFSQTRAQQAHADTDGLPVITPASQTAMYRQAMRNGFWAAIIIIIIGTIAYLLK